MVVLLIASVTEIQLNTSPKAASEAITEHLIFLNFLGETPCLVLYAYPCMCI